MGPGEPESEEEELEELEEVEEDSEEPAKEEAVEEEAEEEEEEEAALDRRAETLLDVERKPMGVTHGQKEDWAKANPGKRFEAVRPRTFGRPSLEGRIKKCI